METRCGIAGGGPAGMMLGFLPARADVDVIVLEKHKDSLKRPHQELKQIGAQLDDFAVTIADFTHLPVHSKFVGLMPQWDFLNFLAEKAKKYPAFQLRRETEVTAFGRVREGTILVMLNGADYWQCAYLIKKGGFAEIQQRGPEAFRTDVVKAAPFLRGREDELKSWDDIRLLSVAVDHLKSWSRPGLLCIGDSAHAR
jgi:2-polyprenyl-6-methoxyphenol hydroxylase-like FAD-dependent oxidoreductase